MVVTVPPSLLVSEWVGKLKGGSSFYINYEIANRKLLHWQEGYGVVSFGTKDLEWVVRYVKKQKEHHAAGSINQRLERANDED
jgi:putative transposase